MAPASKGWRNRIVGHADVDPASLVPHPENWRKHPAHQRAALRTALAEIGWVRSVVVNKRTGRIIDGHLRVAEALDLGAPTVPVEYVRLTDAEERQALATVDALGAMAETNREAYAALLASIGSVSDTMAGLLEAAATAAHAVLAGVQRRDGDDAPRVPATADVYVEPGSLWALGRHRLLCGDATDAESYSRLMAGDLAALVFTDPPYGVEIASRIGTKARSSAEARAEGGKGIQNDGIDAAALEAFLRPVFELILAASRPGAAWYVLGPTMPAPAAAFGAALFAVGVWQHSLVWVKDTLVMGRMDYHYRHEGIYYGWSPGAGHHKVRDRTETSVWEIPRPKRSEDHPTMKPVALVERALRNSSDDGDVVLDPFVGSGTTIIAAERMGRVARAIELDPKYAQVAIERWQEYAGAKAERLA